MKLIFRILTGPLKGKKININSSLAIGRGAGHLSLEDPQISTLHAKVGEGPHGDLFLLDQGSKNGLKVSGERVSSVRLKPGIQILVGGTLLEVQEPQADKPSPLNWTQVLIRELEAFEKELRDQPVQVMAFDPLVSLRFIQGPQAPQLWALGYGPRKVGGQSLDLPLEEPGAPALCFELHPQPKGLSFVCPESSVVKLNGESVSSQALQDGDVISIFQTQIRVELKP